MLCRGKDREALGAAKLNMKALELERECKGLLRDIGEKVYESLQTGEDHSDFLEERMEELEKRYAQIGASAGAGCRAVDVKVCPACESTAVYRIDTAKHCGAVL